MAAIDLTNDLYYEFTAEGVDFLWRALAACRSYHLTWQELWTPGPISDKARATIGLDSLLETEEPAVGIATLTGNAAFALVFFDLTTNDISHHEAVSLLNYADLLTESTFEGVAEHLGLPVTMLVELFATE